MNLRTSYVTDMSLFPEVLVRLVQDLLQICDGVVPAVVLQLEPVHRFAVLEVGMGGRFDATNVIPAPRAAAITRIALDHTEHLHFFGLDRRPHFAGGPHCKTVIGQQESPRQLTVHRHWFITMD